MAGDPTLADGRGAAPAERGAGAVRVEIEVVDRCPGCGVEVTAEAVRAGWKVRPPPPPLPTVPLTALPTVASKRVEGACVRPRLLHDPSRARGGAAPPLPRYPAALPRVPRGGADVVRGPAQLQPAAARAVRF